MALKGGRVHNCQKEDAVAMSACQKPENGGGGLSVPCRGPTSRTPRSPMLYYNMICRIMSERNIMVYYNIL